MSGMGYSKEEADNIATEWSHLTGEKAYQKFSDVSPSWAERIRQDFFPEGVESEILEKKEFFEKLEKEGGTPLNF